MGGIAMTETNSVVRKNRTSKKIKYALFKNEKQVSKFYSTKAAIVIEAYQTGAVGYNSGNLSLFPEYKIKEKTIYSKNQLQADKIR